MSRSGVPPAPIVQSDFEVIALNGWLVSKKTEAALFQHSHRCEILGHREGAYSIQPQIPESAL
jgi:hypothetical protein